MSDESSRSIRQEYYDPNGWRSCPPESLRGHIVTAHLRPDVLTVLGVPAYDIGVAEHRGIPLDWVVKRAISIIATTDEEVEDSVYGVVSRDAVPIEVYREMLVKTVRYIDDVGLADVPWDEVTALYPEAATIAVDLRVDSRDIPFRAE